MRYSGRGSVQGIAVILLLAVLFFDGATASAQNLAAEFFSPADPRYSYTIYYNTLQDLIDSLANNPLRGHLQGFNQYTDQINVYSNAGGLAMTVLAPQNSTSFTLSIPGLNYTKTFTGSDRNATTVAMAAWGVTDPDGIVAQVNAQVAPRLPWPLPLGIPAATPVVSYPRSASVESGRSQGVPPPWWGRPGEGQVQLHAIGRRRLFRIQVHPLTLNA